MGACCEKMGKMCPCVTLGKCGSTLIGKNRKKVVLMGCGFVTLLGLIFNIVGCCGLSDNSATIKNAHWMKYKGTLNGVELTAYTNLWGIRVDFPDGHTTVEFDDVDTSTASANFKDCHDESDAMKSTIITGTISYLGQFNMCFKRSADTDNGCWKLLSILTTLMGIITTFSALGSFTTACYNDSDAESKAYGPGYILPLISAIMNIFVLIVFCVCPSPPQSAADVVDPQGTVPKDGEAIESVPEMQQQVVQKSNVTDNQA